MNYTIEIATTDFESTREAVEGGADRIELCTALSEGGITASYGLIKKCRESFLIPIFPIIRPRAGDFLYTDEEFDIMLSDIKICKDLGCDGIVSGILKKDGRIDKKRTTKMIEAAYPMEFTFHRAFDRCKDPFEALEELITIGCQRILTSGQQPTAIAGTELIRKLVKATDSRMIIMPGSGVRKENIKQLAEETGAIEFHSSVKKKQTSGMEFIHPAFASSEESYSHPCISASDVKDLRKALQ
jgi:copper homeostasis protein